MSRSLLVGILLLAIIPVSAQKKPVAPSDRGYRVIAIDQVIVDKETKRRRPAHADGKIGVMVLAYSRDGQHCLVEYVAARHSDNDDIRAAASAKSDSQVIAFEKSQVKAEVFQPLLKAAGFPDVDFSKFTVSVR